MTLPTFTFGSGSSGPRLIDCDQLQRELAYSPFFAYAASIVAKAGGGQTSATPITETMTSVDTVASGNDSVKLPASIPGSMVFLVNTSANSMQVFGISPDTINAVATGTGVAQAAGKSAVYICMVAGKWFRLLSA